MYRSLHRIDRYVIFKNHSSSFVIFLIVHLFLNQNIRFSRWDLGGYLIFILHRYIYLFISILIIVCFVYFLFVFIFLQICWGGNLKTLKAFISFFYHSMLCICNFWLIFSYFITILRKVFPKLIPINYKWKQLSRKRVKSRKKISVEWTKKEINAFKVYISAVLFFIFIMLSTWIRWMNVGKTCQNMY